MQAVHLDAAQRLLEDGGAPKQVTAACGFKDVDTFRRAFGRRLGLSPSDYRRQYGSA